MPLDELRHLGEQLREISAVVAILLYLAVVLASAVALIWHGASAEWVNALAAVGTLGVSGSAAILGLRIWRSETLGKRKADVAEEVLATSTNVAIIIRTARGATLRTLGADDSMSGFERRRDYLIRNSEAVAKMETACFKGSLYLKPEIIEEVRKLAAVRQDVISALDTLVRDAQEPLVGGEHVSKLLETARSHATAQPGDFVEPRIAEALQAIEAICLPSIKLQVG